MGWVCLAMENASQLTGSLGKKSSIANYIVKVIAIQ
jgi:hypothetical protein